MSNSKHNMTAEERRLKEEEQERIYKIEKKIWCDKMNGYLQQYYKKNWTSHFEGGPKTIYMLEGNTDSSDFHTSLYSHKYETPFTCWHAFAKYLQTSKDYNDYLTRDSDNEDDDEVQLEFKTAKKFFRHLTNVDHMDPVFFVTEDNPLLFWLVKVRGV